MAQKTEQKQYKRFPIAQRLEHLVLIVSFTGLALTGLPQKFFAEQWAQSMISFLGGIESVRILHRFSAIMTMLGSIYHVLSISYKIFVEGKRASMLLTKKDALDVRDWVLYNLGLRKEHPRLPHYNFGEKAEYLALVWGTLLMGATGFMMWNPITTASWFPGAWIPAARAAHGAEAILAVLSIATWHTYNVHFKHFNKSMLTGMMSQHEMEDEHGDVLDEMEKGEAFVIPAEVIAKRKRVFWPYAIILTAILLAGTYWFVSVENSAVTTIPRQDVVIFAPELLPETGDPNVGAALWPTLRCAHCHGQNALGGLTEAPSLRGFNVSFEEFHKWVREGLGNEMHGFLPEEISDGLLFHLWTWLQEGLVG
jgi:cytochrome b subunit of formate dehydrogenase